MVVGGKDSTTMSKDPKAYNLTALYTELDQQGKNGEFDRGLKTANKSNVLLIFNQHYGCCVLQSTPFIAHSFDVITMMMIASICMISPGFFATQSQAFLPPGPFSSEHKIPWPVRH